MGIATPAPTSPPQYRTREWEMIVGQQCHPAGPGAAPVLRFTDRHAELRVPALHRVPSSLDPLYALVRRCLDLIQQNPLPTGSIIHSLNGERDIRKMGGWIAGTVLCSIILLILACNVTGMALGAYGLSKREDPSDYECRGEAGAKFLLVGVALAFLFSWLLVLLVFATFLVGGNIQTLVCRNWVNQEIYKFIDTPGNLPPSMNLSRQLNLRRDSNLSSAYRECKSGAGLWEVLQLDGSYDLDEHLRTPQYTADFQKRLGDFTAELGAVRLLRSEGRQDLETFARSGLDEVDYGRFQEEAKLGESVQFLSRLAPHLKERVSRTTAPGEARLPLQAQQILRQELGCFARKELRYFTQYLNWVGQTVRAAPRHPAGIFGAQEPPRIPPHKQTARQQPGVISTGVRETCPFHIPRVTALKL
ncbi:prominin-2-like [Geospiza fortis]|uniref:Prominin-2-like n=1 Tax=Geospiza fortis TaxID=48883 RepID=A0A6I9ZDX3_GEOFO|nr:prominin-2-like [Geospiza fortis]